VSEQEMVVGIKSYEGFFCFFGTCCLVGGVHMVCKTFFLSWKYCTCFWLRVVGIGMMVFIVRVVCVSFV
jgi:hypothetical protein